jgi:hypothetical protein
LPTGTLLSFADLRKNENMRLHSSNCCKHYKALSMIHWAEYQK